MPTVRTARRAAIAAFASASLAAVPCAHAATLHVTDGAGNCSAVAQGCDLATAVGIAQAGDIVRVHAGSQSLTAPVGPTSGAVTIEGAEGEGRPVLSISGAGELRLGPGSTLRGVDVVSTAPHAITATGARLDRLRVTAWGASTVGVRLRDGAEIRNTSVSAGGSAATAVLVDGDGRLSRLIGVSAVGSGSAANALVASPSGVNDSASVRAVNSILRGYDGASDVRAVATAMQTATVVLDHAATDPAAHTVVGPGAAIDNSRSPVAAAPVFTDRANLDLRQAAASPTIDAGTADIDGDGNVDADDVAAAGPLDLDGTSRQLGLPDIGADEREMPPMVIETAPVVVDGNVTLRVVVQPRGLATTVTAEWSTASGTTASVSADVSGNAPVTLLLPLADLPTGAPVSVRAKASNSAGSSVTTNATVDLPTRAPATDTASASTGPSPSLPAATAPPGPLVTGALPKYVRTKVRRHWGIVDVRLLCDQKVECAGSVLLTRLGPKPRWMAFRVPAGKAKTVSLTLTVAQTRRLKRAGRRGARVLLEVRSLQGDRTFTAVRLNHTSR